jgi:hypothetical protein
VLGNLNTEEIDQRILQIQRAPVLRRRYTQSCEGE